MKCREPREPRAMSEYNPYAPPAAGTEEGSTRPRRKSGKKKKGSDGTGCWQEDRLVVLEKFNGALPDRCVVCNRKTSFKLTKTFLWHHPSYYFLILGGWLIYLIVAAFVRKNAILHLGLCKEHRAKRKTGLTVLWAGVGGSLALIVVSALFGSGALAGVAALGLLVFALVGARMARVISVTKITDTLVWFKAGVPFVDSLPESPDDDD
jgi:hypothetical protein